MKEMIKQHFINVASGEWFDFLDDLAYITTFSGKIKDVLKKTGVTAFLIFVAGLAGCLLINPGNLNALIILLAVSIAIFIISALILLTYAYVFHKYIYMPTPVVTNFIAPVGGDLFICDNNQPMWRIDGKVYLVEGLTRKGCFSQDIIFCKDYFVFTLSYGINFGVFVEKLSIDDLLKLEGYQEKVLVYGGEISAISIGPFFDKFRPEFNKMLLDIKERAKKGSFNTAFSRFTSAYIANKYGYIKEEEEFYDLFLKEITIPEIIYPIDSSKIKIRTFAHFQQRSDYTPAIPKIKADIFL